MNEAIHSESDNLDATERESGSETASPINSNGATRETQVAPAQVAPAQVAPVSEVQRLRHDLRTPLNQILGYSEILLEEADDDASSRAMIPDLNRIHAAGKHLLQLIETRLREDSVHMAAQNPTSNPDLADNAQQEDPASAASVNLAPASGDMTRADEANADAANANDANANALGQTSDAGVEGETSSAALASSEQANGILADGFAERRKAERLKPEKPLHEYFRTQEVAGLQEETSGEGGLLLVVDDNETNRDLLSRRLERQGHQVETAQDGRQALEMIASRPFDVVLLDILMPEMDGYQVLQQLKESPATRHVPVIMISALDEMQSVVRCIEGGAEDYLPKPFDPVLLRARIGASLEKKRAHDREMRLFEQLQSQFKRLQELETLRDDLTNMIVHDLRTPLTSLMGGLQMLQTICALDEIPAELLMISTRSAETLLGLVNDLLDISKMEAGRLQLQLRPLDASTLVRHAFQQITFLAEGKRVSLHHEIAPDVPTFTGDEDKLIRTLVNLLGNAVKFTPLDSTVSVRVFIGGANDSAAVFFQVRDQGPGVPPDQWKRIFEKFAQVETDPEGQPVEQKMSTGLGLTFCKMAVEAHGGAIWVESEMKRGSTFSFRIPLNLQASSAAS